MGSPCRYGAGHGKGTKQNDPQRRMTIPFLSQGWAITLQAVTDEKTHGKPNAAHSIVKQNILLKFDDENAEQKHGNRSFIEEMDDGLRLNIYDEQSFFITSL
ncbi:hypothetical protein NQF87_00940 [Bombella sp. TMW 2.2559]|uniref:Uncharacterized protein n=1 Tax=Bombella dulcis TaxID=2967339 RepID=A0ABT3WF85_9PROT|nr:hypothetical protein [Bombella dulcis]MCX5615551.1 hypothetical protein [Bombella dulcis]